MPPKEGGAATNGAKPRPSPRPVKKEVKTEVKADPGTPSSSSEPEPYRDIPLVSSDLAGWTYHLMKFAHHMPVNPTDEEQFVPPLRLNRKRPPRAKQPPAKGGEPVTDRFNKPVLDVEGHPLVWPRTDEEIEKVKETFKMMEAQKNKGADISLIAPGGSGRAQKARLFSARVKEVHKSSTAARKTMLAEHQPWVLEDYETDNHWESATAPRPNGIEALERALRNGALQRNIDIARATREAAGEAEGSASGDVKAEPQEVTEIKMEQSGRDHAPWIGKLEGDAENKTAGHAVFVLDNSHANGCFKLVPIRNMYRFDQKPAHSVFTADEAEKEFEKQQKSSGPSRFMMRSIRGDTDNATPVPVDYKPGSLLSGSSTMNAYGMVVPRGRIKSEGRGGVHSSLLNRLTSVSTARESSRSGSGSRGLRAVSGFKKEDDDEGGRRRENEGAFDELDYQEDFADDEEKMEGDNMGGEEEETREMEERLKREIALAEQEAEGEDGEDNDDAAVAGRGTREDDMLTGSGKQMKKIMQAFARRDGNEAYESDEEKNPYASDESDGEDPALANPEDAFRKIKEEKERREAESAAQAAARDAAASAEGSALGGPSASGSRPGSKPSSRSNTPSGRVEKHNPKATAAALRRPGSGHANVAQRATSPTPRSGVKSGGARSRSSSPAATPAAGSSLKRKSEHRAESPPGSASQPSAGGESSKRARLNTAGSSSPSSPGPSSPTSAPSTAGAVRQPENEMQAELIALVGSGQSSSMRDLVQEFRTRIGADPGIKERLRVAVTRVLMQDRATGKLRVKDGFLAA